MKYSLYLLRMLLLATCLWSLTGCSEEEPKEFVQPDRLVRNLYLASVMSVYEGQQLTLQGRGFEAGDLLSLRAEGLRVEMPVGDVTAKTARVVVPAELVRGTYEVYVVRGSAEQYVTTVRIYLTIDQEVPDKEGCNLKGIVYCGDRGVAGVRVSDGIETTVTDENGYYWLASLKSLGYVFITLPAGYEPAVFDSDMMGFWAGLTAGTDVCEVHNFELVEVDNDRHVMLVGSDLHLADKQNDLNFFSNGFLTETQAFADSSPLPVYCLIAGDMTWDRYWYDNDFAIADYKRLLSSSGYTVPVFHTMGNHDNDPYVTGDVPGQTPYCNTLGPNYYSFNLGRVHYVVLDDIDWINAGGAEGVVGARDFNALVSLAQMEWLADALAAVEDKTAPLVICLHVQLHGNYNSSFTNVPRMSSTTGGTAALLKAVEGFSDVHFITGHTHYNSTMVIDDGIIEHNTAAVCETWWWSSFYSNRAICVDGTPAGYGVYTFSDKEVEWYYKGIGEEPGCQFRSYDMNVVKAHLNTNLYKSYLSKYPSRTNGGYDYASVGENEVFINVWNYDPEWRVEVFENGVSLPVTRLLQRDPLHTIVFDIPRVEQGAEATSDWASCPMSHIFSATASSATSTLEIKVTDRFGNQWSEQMVRPKAFTKSMK